MSSEHAADCRTGESWRILAYPGVSQSARASPERRQCITRALQYSRQSGFVKPQSSRRRAPPPRPRRAAGARRSGLREKTDRGRERCQNFCATCNKNRTKVCRSVPKSVKTRPKSISRAPKSTQQGHKSAPRAKKAFNISLGTLLGSSWDALGALLAPLECNKVPQKAPQEAHF